MSTNCYLVYDDQTKEGVVIDPADNAPYILNMCSELGINLTALLLTHGHFDHIMAVPVSYTHLDVYKRQPYTCACPWTEMWASSGTVSWPCP